jgi:hypothetical protein
VFDVDWSNPVIWAHYSDKHKGLCLGFDIPDPRADPGNEDVGLVEYVSEPLQFPSNFLELSETEGMAFMRKAIFTKFDNWQYEHEVRFWAPLQNEEGGVYFMNFGSGLRLSEVIIGQKCLLTREEISEALGPIADEVKILKARAAYDKFGMLEDETFQEHKSC